VERVNIGLIGLIIEIVTLVIGGAIYMNGLGVGPQGITPMLAGVAIAGAGLLVGAIMGVTSLVRNGGSSFASAAAVLMPLTILAVLVFRRIGPL